MSDANVRHKLPLPITVIAWALAAMAVVKVYQMMFTDPARREREVAAQETTAAAAKRESNRIDVTPRSRR